LNVVIFFTYLSFTVLAILKLYTIFEVLYKKLITRYSIDLKQRSII